MKRYQRLIDGAILRAASSRQSVVGAHPWLLTFAASPLAELLGETRLDSGAACPFEEAYDCSAVGSRVLRCARVATGAAWHRQRASMGAWPDPAWPPLRRRNVNALIGQ